MKKLEEELAMVEEVERGRSDGPVLQSGGIWCLLCVYDVSGGGRTAMRGHGSDEAANWTN